MCQTGSGQISTVGKCEGSSEHGETIHWHAATHGLASVVSSSVSQHLTRDMELAAKSFYALALLAVILVQVKSLNEAFALHWVEGSNKS